MDDQTMERIVKALRKEFREELRRSRRSRDRRRTGTESTERRRPRRRPSRSRRPIADPVRRLVGELRVRRHEALETAYPNVVLPADVLVVLGEYLRSAEGNARGGSVRSATELAGLRRQWWYDYSAENPVFGVLAQLADLEPRLLKEMLGKLLET